MEKDKFPSSMYWFIFFGMLISMPLFCFPVDAHCFFIDWTSLKKVNKSLYLDPSISKESEKLIIGKITEAKERIKKYYNGIYAKPTIIILKNDEEVQKFMNRPAIPVHSPTKRTFFGTYIISHPDFWEVDNIAHELSHSELGKRLGFWGIKKIPIWFDEGIATQVDYRIQAEPPSEKTDLNQLRTRKQLYTGDFRKNYRIAKYEVKRWLDIVGQKGLFELIEKLKNGEEFNNTYKLIEME